MGWEPPFFSLLGSCCGGLAVVIGIRAELLRRRRLSRGAGLGAARGGGGGGATELNSGGPEGASASGGRHAVTGSGGAGSHRQPAR